MDNTLMVRIVTKARSKVDLLSNVVKTCNLRREVFFHDVNDIRDDAITRNYKRFIQIKIKALKDMFNSVKDVNDGGESNVPEDNGMSAALESKDEELEGKTGDLYVPNVSNGNEDIVEHNKSLDGIAADSTIIKDRVHAVPSPGSLRFIPVNEDQMVKLPQVSNDTNTIDEISPSTDVSSLNDTSARNITSERVQRIPEILDIIKKNFNKTIKPGIVETDSTITPSTKVITVDLADSEASDLEESEDDANDKMPYKCYCCYVPLKLARKF